MATDKHRKTQIGSAFVEARMKPVFICVYLWLILLLCVSAASVAAAQWTQWRGPNGLGISPEKDLPTDLGAGHAGQARGQHQVEDGDPRPRPFVADRVGQPHLPHDVDQGRGSARQEGAGASQFRPQPGYVHPDVDRHQVQARAAGAGGRREDGQDRCGRRRPTTARCSTTVTARTRSPRRRW